MTINKTLYRLKDSSEGVRISKKTEKAEGETKKNHSLYNSQDVYPSVASFDLPSETNQFYREGQKDLCPRRQHIDEEDDREASDLRLYY